jgi:flagellar hook-length control protein FliK
MTALPITPPSAARVDAARKGSSPPSGSSGDFAALLNQTSARTASAEGPKTRPAQPEPRRRGAAAPKDDNKGADVQATAAAQAAQPQPPADGKAAAPQGKASSTADGEAAAGMPSPPTRPAHAAGETPAGQPVADSAAATAAAALVSAATPVASAQSAGASTAPATAQAAVLTAAQPGSTVDPNAKKDGAAPADGTPGGKLQIPAELLGAKGDAKAGQGKDDKNGGKPQHELPPAPTLPPTGGAPVTPAPAVTPATPIADQAAAAPTSGPAITQAQPAATAQTAVPFATGAPQLTRASVLQTAERVQELVRIATTRAGNARATLRLRPAELGQVDVHLRTTRDGLVATIAAHDQVGLDALQQAGNELRRSLEDKGVQLHSLDLQLGAGQNGFSNKGDAREASSGRRGAASTHGLGTDDDVIEDELTITHAPSTPAGALVDVQA